MLGICVPIVQRGRAGARDESQRRPDSWFRRRARHLNGQLGLGLAVAVLGAGAAPGGEIVYPDDVFMYNEEGVFNPDGSVINVTYPPFEAPSDGVGDATVAINDALEVLDSSYLSSAPDRTTGTLYLPNGTYKVSDTLLFTDTRKNRWEAHHSGNIASITASHESQEAANLLDGDVTTEWDHSAIGGSWEITWNNTMRAVEFGGIVVRCDQNTNRTYRFDLQVSTEASGNNFTTIASNFPVPADAKFHYVAAKSGGVVQRARLVARGNNENNWTNVQEVRFVESKFATQSIRMEGQSRDDVKIVLATDASGFSDPQNPKAVIAGIPFGGFNFDAFNNRIANLTIETGDHDGAIGIFWNGNNESSVEDVTIRSAAGRGVTGLDTSRGNGGGPTLFKNISIEGFDYGVHIGGDIYHYTFEYLNVQGQGQAGVRVSGAHVSMRGLNSINSQPAVLIDNPDVTLTLVDSTLMGGSSSNRAIVNEGHLFVRNVDYAGYGGLIRNDASNVSEPLAFGEYTSNGQVYRLDNDYPSAKRTIDLPVRATPDVPWDNPDDWVNVQDFGATPGEDTGDDAAAIQAAIDSMNDPEHANFGKTTLYFQRKLDVGRKHVYKISDTIEVSGNVRRIHGMGGAIRPIGSLSGSTKPVFRVTNTNHPVVVIEDLHGQVWNVEPTPMVEHDAAADLVLRRVYIPSIRAFRTGTSSNIGDAFIENVRADSFHFRNGQRVWARQINPERGDPGILMEGGATLWALGLKHEFGLPVLDLRADSIAEILGGMFWSQESTEPVFKNDRGHLVVTSHAERGNSKRGFIDQAVAQRKPGSSTWNTLATSNLPNSDNNAGFRLPLYLGYDDEVRRPAIFRDSFESGGLSGWTLNASGTQPRVVTSTMWGRYEAQLRSDASMERTIDLRGVTEPKLYFAWRAYSLDGSGEKAQVDVYDGTWRNGVFSVAGVSGNANAYDHAQAKMLDLSGYDTNRADFKIRFRIDASGDFDFFYVDEIAVHGKPAAAEPVSWVETFDAPALDGAQVDNNADGTNTSWSLTTLPPTDVICQVRNGRFEAVNIGVETDWRSELVDIAGGPVTVAIDLATTGTFEAGEDRLEVYCQTVTGGQWSSFEEIVKFDGSGAPPSGTYLKSGVTGDQVRVIIRMLNQNGAYERYFIDNVSITSD